jgi:hypothetical protein
MSTYQGNPLEPKIQDELIREMLDWFERRRTDHHLRKHGRAEGSWLSDAR